MTNGEIEAVVAGLEECRARQFAALARKLGSEEAATARINEIAAQFGAAGEGVVDTEMFIYAAEVCIGMLRHNVLGPARHADEPAVEELGPSAPARAGERSE